MSRNNNNKSNIGEPYQIYHEVKDAGKNIQGKCMSSFCVHQYAYSATHNRFQEESEVAHRIYRT